MSISAFGIRGVWLRHAIIGFAKVYTDKTPLPASDLMGFNPLYLANEGRFVAFVPEEQAPGALEILQSVSVSSRARLIGRVSAASSGRVALRTACGTEMALDRLSGEMLPRIC